MQPANGQAAKRQFAASARTDDYLTNPLQPALSPWEVKAGSIISAALVTAINSDLPGQVIAQVTEPVYDHRTGRTVLIPQGSWSAPQEVIHPLCWSEDHLDGTRDGKEASQAGRDRREAAAS